MADDPRKPQKQVNHDLASAGGGALRRFFSELPAAAMEWPQQTYQMLMTPGYLTFGNPEQARIDQVWGDSGIKPLPEAEVYGGYHKRDPAYAARQVMEFINPVSSALFAPLQTFRYLKTPAGKATTGGLAALLATGAATAGDDGAKNAF